MSDSISLPGETLDITVEPPIVWQKGTYDTLSLREPRAGEIRKAEGQMRNGVNAETIRLYSMHLIAMVSGWPFPAVEQLRVSEQEAASEFLAGFLGRGRKTGET